MDKKLKDKDVIVVSDNRNPGKLNVLAGVENGEPVTVKPDTKNQSSFILFNKSDNIFESFFKNYARQLEEPSRFQFFRIPLEALKNAIQVLKEALKSPEENKKLLSQIRIDEPEKLKNEQHKEESKEEIKDGIKQESHEKKQNESTSKEFKLEEAIKKFGLSVDQLEKNQLTRLQYGGKTQLLNIKFEHQDPNTGIKIEFETKARLSVEKDANGNLYLKANCYKPEATLDQLLDGKTRLTPEQQQEVVKKDVIVNLEVEGKEVAHFVSFDKHTNNLEVKPVKDVQFPDRFRGVDITSFHQSFRQGGEELIDGMLTNDGTTRMSSHISYKYAERGFQYNFKGLTNPAKKQEVKNVLGLTTSNNMRIDKTENTNPQQQFNRPKIQKKSGVGL